MNSSSFPLSSKDVGYVRDFWNANPCGAQYVKSPFGTPEFFREYAEIRYRSEWHLNYLIPFEKYQDKQILEIGCGLGADGARFAQNGAIYTGVDLTQAAVDATRFHFQALGLPGTFKVQNAERMTDFENSRFDLVYSHGVLHHTPNLDNALREVQRVLKPGGDIIIMLYYRPSFNYYVRIQGYTRLKVLAYLLVRPVLPESRRKGNLELHYQNFRHMGFKYLSVAEFPNHCTDGPECPIANSYTKSEIQRLFSPYFVNLRFAVAHFPIHNTIHFFPLNVERFLASRFGWYLFIYGNKV